ncbi:restriction endonuclease subunit S [Mitsuokella multacida]|uniref:restriction endonuclease subunit S n=1 Tax=Mitsuokella multacida TaxID=52226 RepID=UPI0039F44BC1
MNAQDLKNSILQRAIEGKLVPQRKEEGTAKELLAEIRAEKARLIKEKKIKKSKPLPEITDEEKPFDIPESWEWVRLGDIGALVRGSGIKRSETTDEGKPCVRYGELYTTYRTRFSSVMSHTSEEVFNKSKKVHKNDILMALTGENKWDIALAVVYEGEEEVAMGGDMTKWEYHGMNPIYLTMVINSPYGIACKRNMATGDIIVHISNNKLSEIVLPIPPLAEQHRIVAKIEELQPDIDAYDEAQTKLQAIEQRFPDAMKKSLLQYAIEGKLVPQRKEEGTAKDLLAKIRAEKARLVKEKKIKKYKPLPAITDDEKPFDIPNSWEWTRFGDISINMDSERIPLSVTQRRNLDKIYDYYGASGVIDKVDKYLFDRPLMLIGEDGANLLARTKPIAFIARGKYWVNNHAHVIDFPNGIDMKYMTFYMNAINLAAYVTGTAQPKMNQARMNGILIAIPPITEQHRIVAKLEELLPLCQHLTANP